MIESCPVCESIDVEVRGSYRGTHATFNGLHRANCSSCGMVFATPMPDGKVLDEYNASFFANVYGGQPLNPLTTAFFSGIARLRLAHLERYLGKHNIDASSLMELGPGPGFFARSWLVKHPATTYLAVETDTSCHASLREVGVHIVEASAMAEESTPVDLVVMSHVLEHVSSPIKFLKDATRNLRKGGTIFIEVPSRDWEHKLIDEPHLLFFDKGPMQQLLSTLGFGNIEVSYHGQEIDRLRSASVLRANWMAVRSKLITLGFVAPFAWVRTGMEMLTDPLERAAVAPLKAHSESSKPAWWLRAVAQKPFY
jgi:SAM-dependent methyltransferase